jgi:hypothetical protein
MFKFLSQNFFFQNLFVNIITKYHPAIDHNIGKIKLIKNIMWLCELEKIEGSYFEFGVYNGTSLFAAMKCHLNLKSNIERKFYGFDSFDDGFKYFVEEDRHNFFKEGDFISSYNRVKKRFSNFNNVRLIKGYFEETVKDKNVNEMFDNEKCAIIFIDCDLMNPSIIALEFIKPILQIGSIIILDDYWSYKANPTLGVAGAFNKFLNDNENIKVRRYFDYGIGGTSFIIENL